MLLQATKGAALTIGMAWCLSGGLAQAQPAGKRTAYMKAWATTVRLGAEFASGRVKNHESSRSALARAPTDPARVAFRKAASAAFVAKHGAPRSAYRMLKTVEARQNSGHFTRFQDRNALAAIGHQLRHHPRKKESNLWQRWSRAANLARLHKQVSVESSLPGYVQPKAQKWDGKSALNPSWEARTDVAQRKDIKKLADKAGVSMERYIKDVNKRIVSIVSKGEVQIRQSSSALDQILADGRFKTLFETGRSGGFAAPRARADFEKKVMGVSRNTRPGRRTIYAYLAPLPFTDSVENYGDVTIRLKSSVHRRSTFTFGDSLVETESGKEHAFSPQPLRRPTYKAVDFLNIDPTLPGNYGKLGKFCSYIEVQIPNGLTVKDIHSVVFNEQRPSRKLIKKLEARGLKWTMANNGLD
jgi:ribosomal protein L22